MQPSRLRLRRVGEGRLIDGLLELHWQLRNPAVFQKPKTAKQATALRDLPRPHLRHHGVTHFATANAKHYGGSGLRRWIPVLG